MQTSSTNTQLNTFVTWVNAYCARHRPQQRHRERRRLRSGQFRRTLAWFIARRLGGSIAGAIQYKHHGIQMVEGYAGISRAGFRAEVESEQALLRGEQLTDIATTYRHDLASPAADEVRRRLDVLATAPDFPGLVPADTARTRRFLIRYEPDIYPGTHATCVSTAATARCLPPPGAATPTAPAIERCHPLECGNVPGQHRRAAPRAPSAPRLLTQTPPEPRDPPRRTALARRRPRRASCMRP
ncbi:hypothetical protein QRX50_36235 [Amycolatopsis carbonis]|uniref:Uncharacterized protein n=1 Tax=Amycolatopsis carbonis TaxID=715471 RepID=A0A9Y2MTG7_9PSEU|nr:hypothetical protein [Amycolatopsis sp. 2-15]WIX76838.1 hypothetical protein QRX50_36235 [Amycolatopsis sp. 2-15]